MELAYCQQALLGRYRGHWGSPARKIFEGCSHGASPLNNALYEPSHTLTRPAQLTSFHGETLPKPAFTLTPAHLKSRHQPPRIPGKQRRQPHIRQTQPQHNNPL